ncbi:MAG: DUF456 domain-containing protein [Acidimicrobiia bacterium]
MDTPGLIAVGLAIAVGLVGIVVAALPGLILVWGAVLVWALVEQTTMSWIILAIATVLFIVGQVGKYFFPGKQLKEAGIPRRSLWIGAALSIVGFFLVPVVGFIIGFVLGVYLSERQRLHSHEKAWPSTRQALKAAGLSILIEVIAGLWIAGMWLLTVLFLA